MPAYENYVFRLEFQLAGIYLPGYVTDNLLKSWEKINYGLTHEDGRLADLEPSRQVKEMTKVYLAGLDESSNKIEALCAFVKEKVAFNEGISQYPSEIQHKLISEGKGNSAAINLLLISMLKTAGIEAAPVLVSTRSNGRAQTLFPTTRQFNHLIVAVKEGEEYMFLDAASKGNVYNMLPTRNLNGPGFLVNANGHEWVEVDSPYMYEETNNAILTLQTDGMIKGELISNYNGYGAYFERESLREAEDRDAYLAENMTNGFEDIEMISMELGDEEAIGKAFTQKCEVEISDYITSATNEKIYLKPMLNKATEKNPFTLEKRSYPIDFGYARKVRHIFNYVIPEGYIIENIPDPIRMSIPSRGAVFTFQAQAMGTNIQVFSEVHIKNPIFLPEEYEAFKAFYDKIVEKHGERIVLSKANE